MMQQHRRGRYRERSGGKQDRAPYRSYGGDRGGESGGGREKYRDRGRDRDSHERSNTQRSTSSSTSAPSPIPIDLRPSGILTKYLHLSSGQNNLTPTDTRSKYAPPEDGIVPTRENCDFHLFKYNEETDKQVEVPLLNYKSFFVFGRDPELADIVLADEEDGDLVSKQHAVLQFRRSPKGPNTDHDVDGDGDGGNVCCYLMDLGSTNGTFLNDDKSELPKKRYIQLKGNDVFKLGDYDSVVEFMLLEDKSKIGSH